MTLKEFWMLVARYWKLVVAVPVACAIVCGIYLVVSQKSVTRYTANAYIMANSQLTGVVGLANKEIRVVLEDLYHNDKELLGDPDRTTLSANGNANTMTVTITCSSQDEQECIELVNTVAEAANTAAREAYSDFENPYAGSAQRATTATEAVSTSEGDLKYMAIAIFGGLFVAICIIIIVDIRRRFVKTPEGAQEAVELPVLEILPAKNGERLLANVRFASKKDNLESVLIVPVGDPEAAEASCILLNSSLASEEACATEVSTSAPISKSMDGAYAARQAGAVVVAVRQWTDTTPELESTIAELRLAGADVAGLVFAKGELS